MTIQKSVTLKGTLYIRQKFYILLLVTYNTYSRRENIGVKVEHVVEWNCHSFF